MNRSAILVPLVAAAWPFQVGAMGKLPPDTQAGAADIPVICTVDDQSRSKLCHFMFPVAGEAARRMAGAELGWLDAHPVAISGARAGAEVQVMVRLNVLAAKGASSFAITVPPNTTQPASGPEVTAPIWTIAPYDRWADDFIPDRAARMDLRGGATVRCTVADAGGLADCWVVSETPADSGFGYGVLRVLQRVRMSLKDAAGVSVVGRPIVQTLNYDGIGKDRVGPKQPFTPRWSH